MAVFENAPLRYLFTAVLKDGTSIKQTIQDVSFLQEGKSAFFDVMQRMGDVKAFLLESVEGLTKAAVSLEDGHFELNGDSFFVGEEPSDQVQFRLIYFKRNFRRFDIGMTNQTSHVVHYYIGWQATVKGENIQRTIGLL